MKKPITAPVARQPRMATHHGQPRWVAKIPITAAAVPAGEAGGFEVQLASTGQCFQVPAALSVAQVLLEAGIDIPLSCEQGICGTCLTRVLAGEIAHNDLYLTPAEQAANDQFLPCCSRAHSARLVLDL
jgi:vanillate O-demethylase ferredoxin subunit